MCARPPVYGLRHQNNSPLYCILYVRLQDTPYKYRCAYINITYPTTILYCNDDATPHVLRFAWRRRILRNSILPYIIVHVHVGSTAERPAGRVRLLKSCYCENCFGVDLRRSVRNKTNNIRTPETVWRKEKQKKYHRLLAFENKKKKSVAIAVV